MIPETAVCRGGGVFSRQVEFADGALGSDLAGAACQSVYRGWSHARRPWLADFRAAVDKAISQGTTLAEFRKDFDTIVAKYGWSYNGSRKLAQRDHL